MGGVEIANLLVFRPREGDQWMSCSLACPCSHTIVTVDSVGASPKYVVPKLKPIEMLNLIG